MKLKQKDIENMQEQIRKSIPSQEELQRQIDEAMKNLTPQLQQQIDRIATAVAAAVVG
jgi:peptidoglycan hydrolase CwlO-like protein